MALFEARDITVGYSLPSEEGAGAAVLLRHVGFVLEAGLIYDLTGPSGAGKSMLLRACALMMERQAGELLLDGRPSGSFSPQQWRSRVALVPQRASLVPGTVGENLRLPWTLKVHAAEPAPSDADLSRLLERAALDVPLDRDAARLSGGQAARVALLRTFATRPAVLLLDEVDAALDDESARAVGALTAAMAAEGAACLRIRHRASDGFASGTFALSNGSLSPLQPAACDAPCTPPSTASREEL